MRPPGTCVAPDRYSRGVRRTSKLLAITGVLGFLLVGCGDVPKPDVSFFADGRTIVVAPFQYCDVRVTKCEPGPDNVGILAMPANKPIQISVAPEIAETPWRVVVSYKDAGGKVQDAVSKQFSPDERSAFTLHPPTDAVSIESVQVIQLGAALIPSDDKGGFDAAARGRWVVQTP
ncbi:DUF2771 family protein [Pseudonocardiaceae bacterium YIM PH 21723]|nr:DUF2771 family protein [Pseudonocardiaceae bacterium YIM PH 21723]